MFGLCFYSKNRKGGKALAKSLHSPERMEEHWRVKMTKSTVCTSPGTECIAPDYRSGQARLPEQSRGLGSLKEKKGTAEPFKN